MAPEKNDPRLDADAAGRARDDRGRPRRFRPSQVTILVTVGALGLNLAALAIVLTSVTSTGEQVLGHLAEGRTEAPVESAVSPVPSDGGRVNELMAIAEQLEQAGEIESARQVRAAAQRILIAKSEEDGAFEFARRLYDSGHTREARRALYRILARSDQPGTHWGELGARARFLIGSTLAREADGIEIERGGDR
jgi:hypothetical protein